MLAECFSEEERHSLLCLGLGECSFDVVSLFMDTLDDIGGHSALGPIDEVWRRMVGES